MGFNPGQAQRVYDHMRHTFYIYLHSASKRISFLNSHTVQLPLIKFVVSETP